MINLFINYVIRCLFVVCFTSSAFATTIPQLLANDELKVKVLQSTSDNIIARQKVTFKIQVFSVKEFAENISLSYSNLDNAVVLPPSPQVVKETKKIKGVDWFVQTKELIFYPLAAGDITVAPITISVVLQGQKKEQIIGELKTPVQQLTSVIPSSMQADKKYTVTPQMTVIREAENELKKQLNVGDAVSQTYEITGDDMNALMLPSIVIKEQKGVKVYRETLQNKEKFNRKTQSMQAYKVEKITYIFEQEGRYTFPEQHFVWWNINDEKRIDITLPEQQFAVGENATVASANKDKTQIDNNSVLSEISVKQWIYAALFFTFLVVLIVFVIGKKSAWVSAFHVLNKSQIKEITRQYYQNINNQQFQSAIQNLYQLQDLLNNHQQPLKEHLIGNLKALSVLDKLQSLAFATDPNLKISLTRDEGETLIKGLLPTRNRQRFIRPFTFFIALNAEK